MCRLYTLNIFISDDLIKTVSIADFTSGRSGTYAHNALQCTANLIGDAVMVWVALSIPYR
ncbi:hypothetical protein SASC598P14_008790 [Snodgrassella alvi SCGC AB-598-P14]|nr:hypothetical protein SASC598P14_008790 [Snodgrassella alvi SCGC AB-598-P14]